nr:thiamine phosphate synthase [uncultured Albidiferax sp.]
MALPATDEALRLGACLQLGFIPSDAACIAQAWQAQIERTGNATDWPDSPEDFGLRPWPRPDAFPPCPQQLGLYAVLPDAAWVGRMARAGVPTVQLRFKSDDAQAVQREIQAAVAAVQGTPALLFINDHWQAAIEAGAYGVHLGQEDLDLLQPANLQAIRSAGLRLGVSTHGYAEMLRADRVSPSYIALGAVYPTTLKRMATAPQGTARLAAYARLLRHYPLVAIGGIDTERLPEVLASGVGSVGVVRALTAAADPELAAAELGATIQKFLAAAQKR